MISSPRAQRAFDIESELAEVRKRYGEHYFGQCCLLARRLVEAGVRIVQINWLRSNIGGIGGLGFDTHSNHFTSIRDELYPPTDQAFSVLLEDLEHRGLLDETLVIFYNEFGRTPKVNPKAGVATTGRSATASFWPAAESKVGRSTAPRTKSALTRPPTRSRPRT